MESEIFLHLRPLISGNTPQVASITVTPSNGTCTGTPQTFTITVNPIPSVNSAATGIICSSVAQNYTILSSVTGTTYSWSRAEVPGISNPEALDQTSNPITESFINTTASPIDVVYIITPSANGCEGSTFTYTVTVNPPPTAGLSSNDNIICAGEPVIFTGTGGISYEFFIDGVSQGTPGATATFTATALTNGQVVTVKAFDSKGCFAISDGITTTVNDLPANRTVAAEESAVCIGNGTNITVASSLATTTYQLRIGNSPIGSAITGDGGTIYLPTGALTSTSTFNVLARVTATDCSVQMSATPTVTPHEQPTATSGGNQTICEDGTAIVNDASATNFETILWTHDGSGTLSGANTLTPSYAPGAGDAGHDVTLTLTASNNGCTPATAFYTVHVDALPTAVAGGSDAICPGGSATVTGTSASNGTILWDKGDGQGILTGATTLNPTYSASILDDGTIILTMTVTSNNSCSPQTATATYTLSVTPTTAEAGPDLSTCSGTGAIDITSGSGSENSAVTAWSTSGTGFFSDTNSLTDCTYTPSPADIAAGSVTITLTAFAFSPCTNAIDTKKLTIHPSPTADAGTDLTICSNSGAVNITAGASATGYASIQWSSNGTGTFTNENSVTTCTYTPSTSDISAGSVELTLTAYANLPCSDVTSSKTLTITAAPTAEAGTAVTTCSNSAPVNITAGATASNANGISWSSSGTGSFANGNSLTLCTYQPSTADKTAGSVTLTLTVTGNSPCSSAVDDKVLTIKAAPTANAGSAMSICYAGGEVNITSGSSSTNSSSILWTSSGTGTFTNDNSLTLAAYTPSAADIFAGDVILTLTAYGNSPCSSIVSTKTLSITPAPTANAGTDIYTCSGSGAVNITAGSNASNYTTVTWSSDGSGTFTNVHSLTACTYLPSAADIADGSVLLTLTAFDDILCPNVTSSKSLNITTSPTASTTGSHEICVTGSYTLADGEATATDYTTIIWTEDGAGSITAGANTLKPTYTPAAGDAGKTVKLTLTASKSPCADAVATYLINVDGMPTASAGGSQTICLNGTATVIGASASNGTILWESSGGGSLSNETTVSPTYTPAVGDVGHPVTLTMTVTSINACAPATATATYTVNVTQTTANAGNPVTTCSISGPVNITSGASVTNSPAITWTSSGTGTFARQTSLTLCTYNPSAADISAGSVTLTLTAFGNPPCANATSTKILTIEHAPLASAGGSQTICETGTATVSGASASFGSILWTENGAGSLSNETTLTPTYTAAQGDAGNTVTLTMTVTGTGTCSAATATATFSVVVNELPTASAGGSQTICENGTAIISGTSASNGKILWSHDGAGSLENETTLYPTYIAAHGDAGKTITLTMTVTSDNACSAATATATYTVFVLALPTASAVGSQTICVNGTATVSGASSSNGTILWSHNGAGSLINETTLTPTYTPDPGDAGHTVTLTMTVSNSPCSDATAIYTVIVDELPFASAGGSQTICENETATVSGTASSNGTIAWTEDGAGSITSGENTLTPTYTPSAGDADKTVTLTMTVTSNNSCAPATATATFTVNVRAIPTATAGGSQTICVNGTVTVNDASSSNGTILWTHNGSGLLSGETSLTPTYTPSNEDAGHPVILTMTVSNGPCPDATAIYTVNVDPLPVASAGGSTTICSTGAATVSGATASNGTILWTTSNGAGTITNATTITPTYTAVKSDAGKAIILTMTVTSNNACGICYGYSYLYG